MSPTPSNSAIAATATIEPCPPVFAPEYCTTHTSEDRIVFAFTTAFTEGDRDTCLKIVKAVLSLVAQRALPMTATWKAVDERTIQFDLKQVFDLGQAGVER